MGSVLKKIEKYGKELYNEAGRTSKFYGTEVAGEVWNPWLYRRWLPSQLEERLRVWKLSGSEKTATEAVNCGVKTYKKFSEQTVNGEAAVLPDGRLATLIKPHYDDYIFYTTNFQIFRIMEDIGGEVFEEMKHIFPIHILRDSWGHEISSYQFARGISNPKEYEEAFAKAGVYYWNKSKVLNGEESLEEVKKILDWTPKQVEAELNRIADLVVNSETGHTFAVDPEFKRVYSKHKPRRTKRMAKLLETQSMDFF